MCKSNVSICKYCDKEYTHRQSKYTHEKTCKMKDTKEEVLEKVADKDKVINDLKKQIEILLTKVGNTTTNYNYIVINAFGKENIDYLTTGGVNKLIQYGPFRSIPRLLKNIHFNPKHKENHNVKIPNRKEKYAEIYNGEKWELRDKRETIDDLTGKAYGLLEDHFDGENKHMDTFIKHYDNDDEVIKKVYNETEMMILNNQNTI